MRDMQRIESVLSSEQLRQVEEMKKKDQVHKVFCKANIYSLLHILLDSNKAIHKRKMLPSILLWEIVMNIKAHF